MAGLEVRFTTKEFIKRIRVHRKLLQTVIFGLRSAKIEQEKIFARGGTAAEVAAKVVNTDLVALEQMRDEVEDDLLGLQIDNKTVRWARTLRVGTPLKLHSFVIDVSDKTIGFLDIEGASFNLSEIPFHKVDSDILEITNASNSAMNGRYTTFSCTASVIVMNETIPGSDIANEKSMVITLREEFM